MNIKLPLSVFIIAKNEEERLPYTIKSVIKWTDEVIVVDSGSTDNTIQIAKELGAKTIFNQWKGYGEQKIFAQEQCKNKWVLNLDADEEVSLDAKNEIINLFKNNSEPIKKAYYVDIKTIKIYETKPKFFAPTTHCVRLYHSDYGKYNNSTVHDRVDLKDNVKTGKIKGLIYHRCFKSYAHAVEKINFYSTMQAEDMIKRNKIPSIFRIIFEPFFAFFKIYFLRKHIFLGIEGWQDTILYIFARTLRLSKARELHKLSKISNKN